MHRGVYLLSQIMTGAAVSGCRLPLPAAVRQGLQRRGPGYSRQALFFIAQVLQPNRA
jgi:hypothetical protein